MLPPEDCRNERGIRCEDYRVPQREPIKNYRSYLLRCPCEHTRSCIIASSLEKKRRKLISSPLSSAVARARESIIILCQKLTLYCNGNAGLPYTTADSSKINATARETLMNRPITMYNSKRI